MIVIILLGLFTAINNSGILASVSVDSNSSYFAFLLFGVLAGLSSCAALVGGLLLSLSKQWSETYIASDSTWQRMKPFTMFNIGRIVSFFILGGVLGMIGGALGVSITSSSLFTVFLTIGVALLMAVMGLQMLGVQWANRFQIKTPKFLTHRIANEQNFSGKYMPFLVGALTFLLPCGFTLVAQGLALTSGSFLTGSLIMFFFALGTLPMLAAIGFSSASFVTKPRVNIIFNAVAGILLLLFAVYNINSQLNLLGVPSLSDIKLNFTAKTTAADNEFAPVNKEGFQEISLTAEGFSYTPTSPTTLKAGVPARIIMNNKGIQGCGAYVTARGLMNGYFELQQGQNLIDLGEPKPGTYKVTCSMGMVPPVTINVL
jgi:sulfite exporter TauE/SafE